jgi:hypothetical protein
MKAIVALAAAVLLSGCSYIFFGNLGSLFVTEEAQKALHEPSVIAAFDALAGK